ncbi:Helix-turn-helix [Halolactibacillus halophilus]|uniref:Helix-turn-helix n=1 Tax=Halolactibacillus halophilus TaxID=306540 RepID=A0A1I5MPV0_9BACI|nr:helix-turn-helix transcriptional regulator [Halolactibacillus halophilus]GEM01220.1 transcriptional regulator [Halolactibacillus halophilus]SFP11622.1 Helix-turn-helix [Halolactibacillus halophilus]
MLRVKELLEEKNISIYQLSKLTGLYDSTLNNIVNNSEANPTFNKICKIADALEVSLDELRGDKHEC